MLLNGLAVAGGCAALTAATGWLAAYWAFIVSLGLTILAVLVLTTWRVAGSLRAGLGLSVLVIAAGTPPGAMLFAGALIVALVDRMIVRRLRRDDHVRFGHASIAPVVSAGHADDLADDDLHAMPAPREVAMAMTPPLLPLFGRHTFERRIGMLLLLAIWTWLAIGLCIGVVASLGPACVRTVAAQLAESDLRDGTCAIYTAYWSDVFPGDYDRDTGLPLKDRWRKPLIPDPTNQFIGAYNAAARLWVARNGPPSNSILRSTAQGYDRATLLDVLDTRGVTGLLVPGGSGSPPILDVGGGLWLWVDIPLPYQYRSGHQPGWKFERLAFLDATHVVVIDRVGISACLAVVATSGNTVWLDHLTQDAYPQWPVTPTSEMIARLRPYVQIRSPQTAPSRSNGGNE